MLFRASQSVLLVILLKEVVVVRMMLRTRFRRYIVASHGRLPSAPLCVGPRERVSKAKLEVASTGGKRALELAKPALESAAKVSSFFCGLLQAQALELRSVEGVLIGSPWEVDGERRGGLKMLLDGRQA